MNAGEDLFIETAAAAKSLRKSSDSPSSGDAAFLETPRLIFHTWTETDVVFALGLWGDPRVTQYIDARGKLSVDDVKDRLVREIAGEKKYGVQYWPIFLRSTGEHVGCCGLRPYDLSRNIYEIGFHIRSDLWGKGFASEAARSVMAYAFTKLSINGLFAGHNPHNTASRHLLQKLGFRYTHDEYYAPTGLYHPSYVLTVDEYRNLKKTA
jgi:RimJ/RimL family protein N-acetyltransferase